MGTPEPKEATPEPKEATPKEATPEPKEATPEPKEATPEPVREEAVETIGTIADEPKEATPEPKEVTPEPKEATPEVVVETETVTKVNPEITVDEEESRESLSDLAEEIINSVSDDNNAVKEKSPSIEAISPEPTEVKSNGDAIEDDFDIIGKNQSEILAKSVGDVEIIGAVEDEPKVQG